MDEGNHDMTHPPVQPPPATKSPGDNLHWLSVMKPAAGVLAGTALRHAYKQVERLMEKHTPMTFKFGITHDVIWRWSNKIYGYNSAPEKWTSMVILFESDEPYGPAMLEAALIERFESIWFAIVSIDVFLSSLHLRTLDLDTVLSRHSTTPNL